MTGNTYIFYHIYCNENTEQIVRDQITKILFGGLYAAVTSIRCFLTGDPRQIQQLRELIPNYGAKFIIQLEGPGDRSYERFTLQRIHDVVQPQDKFLYIHSKGVSNINIFSGKPQEKDAIYWWRTWMEWNLIQGFQSCLDLLNTYDIVGCPYSEHMIGPHFSGNFWWSTGAYFLKLPRTIGPFYNDPESYIFKGKPNYKELDAGRMPPNTDLYGTKIYGRLYVD